MKTVNLEEGMPLVRQALSTLDRELTVAVREGYRFIKFIHGYGSSGQGGDIRIGVQKELRQSVVAGKLRECIFGEDWTISNEKTWGIIKSHPILKQDRDLGRKNAGITIVVL